MHAANATTVEPLNNGHHWKPKFCPLWRGVPSSEFSGIFPVGVLCHCFRTILGGILTQCFPWLECLSDGVYKVVYGEPPEVAVNMETATFQCRFLKLLNMSQYAHSSLLVHPLMAH